MKVPYQRHLIWMLLTGKARDRIEKVYDALTIPRPTTEVLEDTERHVLESFPLPNSTRRRIERRQFDEKDITFFEKCKFGYLYKVTFGDGHSDLKDLHRELKENILDQPIVRIAIECCLIKKIEADEICALVQSGFGIHIHPDVIKQFEQIFFDTSSFDKDDWRAYLNHVAETGENYAYGKYFAALTKSRDEVMHLVGLPTRKSFSNFLETVLVTSDYKFKFYSRQGSQEGDRAARYWADIGLKAGERFEKYAAKDATDFASTIQTEFTYVNEEIPMAEADLISLVKTQELEDKSKVGNQPAPPAWKEMEP
jgi:hypothetical protein